MSQKALFLCRRQSAFKMADYMIEIGPGAGKYGGRVLRAGAVGQCAAYETDDYEYDYDLKSTAIDENKKIMLKGARTNNLKNIDVSIPLNKLVCVIGVSGSGKSSLVSKTLYPAIAKTLGRSVDAVGEYDRITGTEGIKDKPIIL